MIREDLLQALPGEIAAQIHEALPGLQTCRAHWGTFNLEELQKSSLAAPAVLVSCLSLSEMRVRGGPEYDYAARMLAYVITRDRMGLPRDEGAAAITGALMRMIPGRRWRLRGVDGALALRAEVLVNNKVRDAAASLFVVEWVQPVSFDEIPVGESVPLELYLGQSPDVGPGHEDAYAQIGGGS